MRTTKCGNQYTETEWAEMMGNWDTEVAEIADAFEKEAKIRSIAIDQMIATGEFDDATRSQLRAALNKNWDVQFGSPEKAEAAQPIFNWLNSQMNKIW